MSAVWGPFEQPDIINQPLAILNERFIVVGLNRRFCRTFQVKAGEADGQAFFKIGGGIFDFPELRQELDRISSGLSQGFQLAHDFTGMGIRLITADTCPLYCKGTQRKLILLRIEDTKKETIASNLLIHSPNPIVVVDALSSIRYVNPAFEELTGFTLSELIGRKPPYPWWTNPEKSTETLPQILRATRPLKLERLFQKKNGERLWIEITTMPVLTGGKLEYYISNWVDVTRRQHSDENMKAYISKSTQAWEDERRDLAGEVHDLALQSLAYLILELDALIRDRKHSREEVIGRLEIIRDKADGVVENLRRFCHKLYPGVINEIGLVAALEILVEDPNMSARLSVAGDPRRLPVQTEMALFRLAQEALSNIKRHSGATEVMVHLKFTAPAVELVITDNGRGFEVPEIVSDLVSQQKLGLIRMQEYANLAGGQLRIRSKPGKGTAISITVPANS